MSVFRSRPTRRSVLQHAGAAAAMLSSPGLALAQEKFPSRPINLICPWPPGGSTDRHMRAIAELAGKHFGQNVIIQNQPGAGGTNGPGAMALNAKPDGYTIAQYPISMIRVAHMQKTQWHPINDFTFIIGITGYTFGFVVRSDSPYKTFEEYVEAARKAPGQISFGSTGIGTSPHLLLEQVSVPAKIQLNHIPYKGNADLMQALMGGHVMAASDASGWDRFVDAGQMRLLVTFGEKRTKRWPDRADCQGARLRHRRQLALRLRRPEGHGPGDREGAARRLQEGDGRAQAPGDARHAEPGRLVQDRRRVHGVGQGHVRAGPRADRAPRPVGEVTR